MSEKELHELVCRLAEEGAWRALVHEDPERRRFERLLRDDDVDVWVLSWMQFHDTGYHDHDVVLRRRGGRRGRGRGGAAHDRRRAEADDPPQGRDVLVRSVARAPMHNETPRLAVSIHAYSPPLTRLGAYVIEADGTLRRLTQTGDSELAPLTA